jgi:hypothetical protein
MLSRNHKIRESHGPLQSNGICLLDLPFHSHLKPIASTSLAMALPHVATVPGPVSLPGGLIVCTRLPQPLRKRGTTDKHIQFTYPIMVAGSILSKVFLNELVLPDNL